MRLAVRLFLATCTLGAALTIAEAQICTSTHPNEPELVREMSTLSLLPGGTGCRGLEIFTVFLSAEVLTDGTVGEVRVVRPLI